MGPRGPRRGIVAYREYRVVERRRRCDRQCGIAEGARSEKPSFRSERDPAMPNMRFTSWRGSGAPQRRCIARMAWRGAPRQRGLNVPFSPQWRRETPTAMIQSLLSYCRHVVSCPSHYMTVIFFFCLGFIIIVCIISCSFHFPSAKLLKVPLITLLNSKIL